MERPVVERDLGGQAVVDDPAGVPVAEGVIRKRLQLVEVERLAVVALVVPCGELGVVEEDVDVRCVGACWALGTSWVAVEHDMSVEQMGELDGVGIRYLTVQIHDVEGEHRRLLDLGFAEGRAPVRLGDTVFISFVRASDGTWIELSHRAWLAGPLPDVGP